ncbi:MAG: hypothetical protein JXA98_06575 [Methanosarcinaceae archaeon]|nr:hypothetical protein [Methanosarcinaceae archaeon]
MTEEITEAKIKHLLGHWIEHNESHSKSFRDWAKKLQAAGFGDVAGDILLAADKMDESTGYLIKAKENR